MEDKEFWSEGQAFGLRIAEEELQLTLYACKRSGANETGGILVGHYTPILECALVTAVSIAPSDSKKGRTWFHRGTDGLQQWLNLLWLKKRNYYLGEWHFHPSGHAFPSQTDIEQMNRIANAMLYQCPEPLLVVIGGNMLETWGVRVYVFPRGKDFVELYEKSYDLDSLS